MQRYDAVRRQRTREERSCCTEDRRAGDVHQSAWLDEEEFKGREGEALGVGGVGRRGESDESCVGAVGLGEEEGGGSGGAWSGGGEGGEV